MQDNGDIWYPEEMQAWIMSVSSLSWYSFAWASDSHWVWALLVGGQLQVVRRTLQQGRRWIFPRSPTSARRHLHPIPARLSLIQKGIDLQEYRLCVEPVFDELNIYSKTALYAPVLAPVRVHRGGIAVIAAPVHGDLVVHAGAAAVIYGILLGNLTNNGGTVHVYGSVFGKVSGHGGETRVFAPPVREQ